MSNRSDKKGISRWNIFQRFFSGKKTVSDPKVLKSSEFERRIQQERARVDRTGSSFTLLSFTVLDSAGKPDGANGMLDLLASVINERTRISDVTGIHQNGHKRIGVLLPETPYTKSFNLVGSIENIFTERAKDLRKRVEAPEILCEVYTYPTDDSKVEAFQIDDIDIDSEISFLREHDNRVSISNAVNENLLVHERIG